MSLNRLGRTFCQGKALSEDLRSAIIDAIVENGGDYTCGLFMGNYSDVGRRFNVSGQTVKNIWEKFCETGKLGPRDKKGSQKPPHLTETELDLIEFLKQSSPSMPIKKIHDVIDTYCYVPGGTSRSAISRAVTSRMSCGPMSFKRISTRPIVKFTPENVDYCQDFLNYMSSVDPYCIKCFDEAGFKLPDVAKPNYGHSVVGEQCIEVQRYMDTPNVTLQVLAGLEGILYANTVDGTTDTHEFLNFFGEASNNFPANGEPVLRYGDHILLDNHATHHNEGGYALGHWMDQHGIEVVYLPTYSPEFNPIELAFHKMKTVAKQENIRQTFHRNIHAGVYSCIEQISEQDMRGFYRCTGYINL